MAKKTIIAAGAFSLLLVGTWGKAQAGEPDRASRANGEVVQLFGKTICSPRAPSDAHCDWRWPAAGQSQAADRSDAAVTVFGARYCFGETATGQCDYRFPPTSEAPTPKRLRLLGLDVCFGSSSPACELRLPALPQDEERRATL